MIKFASEEVRTQFHSLRVELQKDWERIAAEFFEQGKTLKIYYIEEVMPVN